MACFRHREIPNTMLMNDGLRKLRAVFRVPSRAKWFRIHMQYIILTYFTTKKQCIGMLWDGIEVDDLGF